MFVVIKFFCRVSFKAKNDVKLNNKQAEFSLIKSTKWDDAWYFELKNNDIQSSTTSMKKKLRKMLNRILKEIDKQRSFSQLNDFESF